MVAKMSGQDSRDIETVRLVTREYMRDPYAALSAVREASPSTVPIVANGWRQWIICRYDDVQRVLSDRSVERELGKRLQSVSNSLVRPEKYARLPDSLRQGVIDRDGDDHTRLRALISDEFQHERATGFRPIIQEFADQLLDELPLGGTTDLIEWFAHPLAAAVIAKIVGIPPADRHKFPQWWSSIHTGTTVAEVESAARQMQTFCREMIEFKRARPGDDVITCLIQGTCDGQLSEDEATSTLANLLIGGMESATLIANSLVLLLTHRDQLVKLQADMRLLPNCIEEALRYESPFRLFGPRVASKELFVDGTIIPAGELIALCPAAANRDPRRFEDPDIFDITRERNPHLAFGYGMHYCLGVHVARLEASIGLASFLGRFPKSELAISWQDLRWQPGPHQRQLHSLPVYLHREVN